MWTVQPVRTQTCPETSCHDRLTKCFSRVLQKLSNGVGPAQARFLKPTYALYLRHLIRLKRSLNGVADVDAGAFRPHFLNIETRLRHVAPRFANRTWGRRCRVCSIWTSDAASDGDWPNLAISASNMGFWHSQTGEMTIARAATCRMGSRGAVADDARSREPQDFGPQGPRDALPPPILAQCALSTLVSKGGLGGEA